MPMMRAPGGQTGYRPDIDGLRALAIVPVVAFHAGYAHVSGGFVGVDVFFVVSGFLITGLLLKEQQETGRIRLLDFYARRVRRLLPALTLMLLATLAVGFLVLSPAGDQQRLAQQAIAVSLFASNGLFWRLSNDYFAPDAERLPLLHTWTLAVEEQFYVIWPLVVILVALIALRAKLPFGRTLAGVLVVGVVVSFALSLWVMRVSEPAAFYLTPFRAWELGVGALLAMVPSIGGRTAPPWLATAIAGAGVAAILAAVVTFNSDTAFPGVAVMLPVAGSLAVIVGGGLHGANPVSRALAWTPLRLIGKVSYSWYLWHWPFLAMARAIDHSQRDIVRDTAIVLGALAVAAISHPFFEEPIRRRQFAPFKTVRSSVLAGLAMLLVCILAGAGLYLHANSASRPGTRANEILVARSNDFGRMTSCHHERTTVFALPKAKDCVAGAPQAPAAFLLFGDSVAQQMSQPLDAAAKDAGVGMVQRTANACRAFRVRPREEARFTFFDRDCVRFNRVVMDDLPEMIRDQHVKGVVVAGLWTATPDSADAADLIALVTALRAKGLRVLLVAETPHGELLTPDCLAYHSAQECSVSREKADAGRAAQMAYLRQAAAIPGVRLYDPDDDLCEGATCGAVVDGVIAYRDANHLSRKGGMLLTDKLKPNLVWLTSDGGDPPAP